MEGKGVLGAFLGCLVLITYRDFKTPDSSWPLGPVPPPYRFTWAAVVFGILAIFAEIASPRIANVVALGVLIGTLYDVVVNPTDNSGGLKSMAPGYSDTHNPINNGATGSTAMGKASGTEQV